ncbi:putative C-S lyase [Enterobacteriaceae endosymbiont of Plateumaris consimilis]|uniref:MalY/PatB family protein n=1 Tax=Enterobacteriaceae endosymbiont of Plateumaris consimilis TaxID=2675794 RepID=UPI001448C3AB|nr:PatB family C-S lyase [Enterobacteriaceae endosymbiont of Plateumaris consimilis]QJC28822.1 putative C-S lyase [Enterobacteriaceae endosymbiont of Plateumaris consimilis]
MIIKNFDFNKFIDRNNSDSLKWNKYNKDIIPLWIADSDFSCPPCVLDALKKRINHGVLGYGIIPKNLSKIIIERLWKNFKWEINPEWIIYINGVVCGLNLTVRTFTTKKNSIIIPIPIYPPFIYATNLVNRHKKYIKLIKKNNRLIIDFNFLNKNIDGNEKLIMLCNPHNPVGTVYKYYELEKILEFVKKYNLIVCSDEIHCDLIFEKNTHHIPFASINDDAAKCTITFMSPSKSFNISGLNFAIAIIPNKKLRDKFNLFKKGLNPNIDILSYIAAESAWTYGNNWLNQQIKYLKINRDFLFSKINKLPYLSMLKPEATYLGWIDCSKMKISNPVLYFEKYGIGLSSGKEFGNDNFIRFNFACTHDILKKALKRIEYAIHQL